MNFVDKAVGIYVQGFSVPGTDGGKSLFSSGSVDTNNLSYKIGLQYTPTRDTMMYLTYARGYKGPAINNVSPGLVGQSIVNPEIPLDWEAGVKASLSSNRLMVNLALFNETIKDFQAQVFGVQAGVAQFTFANASHLYARGVQLSVSSRPVAGLTLNGSVLYNHATYDHFVVQCDAGYLIGCVSQNGIAVTDVKGLQLAGAPRWRLTFAANYRHPVANKLDLFAALDGSHRGDVRTLAAPDPNIVIGGYALVNSHIGLESRDDRYRVALFAKNLFNKRARGNLSRSDFARRMQLGPELNGGLVFA